MNDNKSKAEDESGDPGRTPGSAEGDRETVEADLKEKHLDSSSDKSDGADKGKNSSESAGMN
jgi:hypothetical protein